jgi:biotin-dependent carboxylase-like uncharacterized protein
VTDPAPVLEVFEVLEVLEPGLLLTVQDLGRRGFEHLGVPRAGAADPLALARANAAVGNDPGAAALEATLLGPRLRALREVDIAVAGADLGAVVEPGGRAVVLGEAIRLGRDDVLAFEETGDPGRGCRAYIAVAGGIDVRPVLGSRSTSLVGGFGGFDGRPLRSGDVLAASAASGEESRRPTDATPAAPESLVTGEPIELLPGPAAREPGGDALLAALLGIEWTVSISSDRRGLRLEADRDLRELAVAGDRPSHGVVPGTIQLTPSGQPLVLMPDAGTTGGYPVIAIVTSAELHRLGQLAPGATVRFAHPARHPSVTVRA